MNDNDIMRIIASNDNEEIETLFTEARKVREENYGKSVYIRGLIEFSNYCKNDCYYCGIRHSNANLERYRLSLDEILECCRMGDQLGIQTFVLQSGEDPWFTTERVTETVSAIRKEFPNHAITLSIGERPQSDYEQFFKAGANRFLLRHETANNEHYAKLHPSSMSLENRKQCLWNLKKIGYQVGAGFMVGTPHQTPECLLEDIRFLEELQPQMVGIGPFIPQKDTPFADKPRGDINLCLKMIALTRLILPKALIPATTAMGTIAPNGRELALDAGANVFMPMLTPVSVRKLYALYDDKICIGDDAVMCIFCMKNRIKSAGFEVEMVRGDAKE